MTNKLYFEVEDMSEIKTIDFNKAKFPVFLLDSKNIVYASKPDHFINIRNTILERIINNTNLDFSNIYTDSGQSDLHYLYNSPQLLKLALQKLEKLGKLSSTINKKNNQGQTLLIMAHNNPEVVKLLLQYGADYTIKDNSGLSIFAYADADIFHLLEAYANAEQTAEYECLYFVARKLDKKYQHQCLSIAEKVKDGNIQSFLLLLAGDITKLTALTYNTQNLAEEYRKILNIAHGYALLGNTQKARELYKYYIMGAKLHNESKSYYNKTITQDLHVISKIYGKDQADKVLNIWQTLNK